MPFCPECKSEYRRGFKVWPDCGIPLIEELPETIPVKPSKQQVTEVQIAVFPTQLEAEMWAELLLNNGVRSSPNYHGAGGDYLSRLSGPSAAFELRVRSEDVERAKKLLAIYRDPKSKRRLKRRDP